jgi:hypothetical protein
MYLSSHSFERVLEFVQKEEMTARVSPDWNQTNFKILAYGRRNKV